MRGSFRQITLILSEYKVLKCQRDNTIKTYDNFTKDILRPVDTTIEAISKTYNMVSDTENRALNLAEYKKKIDKLNLQISVIETAFDCLTDREKRIIELKYFEKYTWSEVATEVLLSEKWCKEIKNVAFKKLVKTIPVEIFPSIFFE